MSFGLFKKHTHTHTQTCGDDSHRPATVRLCAPWQSYSTAGYRLQIPKQSRSLPAAAAVLRSAIAARVTTASPTHMKDSLSMLLVLLSSLTEEKLSAWLYGSLLACPHSPLSLSDIRSARHPVGPEDADTAVATAPVPARGAPSLHMHTHNRITCHWTEGSGEKRWTHDKRINKNKKSISISDH